MKTTRFVILVCFVVFTTCLSLLVFGFSFSQMVLTITIPDGDTSGMSQAELVVPEGAYAVNFTVWGAENSWGIKSENASASGESFFVYYPELDSGDEYTDAESSEALDSGDDTTGYGYDYNSELSRLTLPPGTYIVWMEGTPGTTMTIQYLLEER